MIVKDLLPLRIVEKTGFRCFVSGFDKLYTLPSRATLRDQLIPEMYNQVQGEGKNQFSVKISDLARFNQLQLGEFTRVSRLFF